MGMLLRRYHKPIEEAPAPEVAPGTTPTEEEARAAAEANAQKVAAEQQAQADAAAAHGGTSAANAENATGAESVAPIIQEAGAQEVTVTEETTSEGTPVITEPTEPPTVPVTAEGSDTPGDVSVVTAEDLSVAQPVDLTPAPAEGQTLEIPEGLNRGSSTADWRAFAKGKLEGSETMSRDDLAEHFLGPKG